jgi:hypothetical protein
VGTRLVTHGHHPNSEESIGLDKRPKRLECIGQQAARTKWMLLILGGVLGRRSAGRRLRKVHNRAKQRSTIERCRTIARRECHFERRAFPGFFALGIHQCDKIELRPFLETPADRDYDGVSRGMLELEDAVWRKLRMGRSDS